VDPNVLVSAAISAAGPPRRILEAWHAGRFEMLVSYNLLYELEAVLLRDRFRSKLTVSDVLEYVLWIREGATLTEVPESLEVEINPDPDDDYLWALAVSHEHASLVSGDSHLLGLVGGPVSVVSPREFMEALEADR
jgi:putative PIN family toxin of toxin-antitoxin system